MLGLQLEFEAADPPAVGLRDDADLTLILAEAPGDPSRCNLYVQVADVDETFHELVGRGVVFENAPPSRAGDTARAARPDRRLVGLWDERSMQAHAGSEPS